MQKETRHQGPKHTLPYNTVCEPQRLSEATVYNIKKREMEH